MKSRFAATREPRAFCLVLVSISSLGVSVSCTWYLRHLKMTHPQQHIRDNGTHSPAPHTCRDDGTHPPPPPHVRGTNPPHAEMMVPTHTHMPRWWYSPSTSTTCGGYSPSNTCINDSTHHQHTEMMGLTPPTHMDNDYHSLPQIHGCMVTHSLSTKGIQWTVSPLCILQSSVLFLSGICYPQSPMDLSRWSLGIYLYLFSLLLFFRPSGK